MTDDAKREAASCERIMPSGHSCGRDRDAIIHADGSRRAGAHQFQIGREGLCDRCRREYVTPWFTPNELWNSVADRGPRDEEAEWHFLCLNCFTEIARVVGVEASFTLSLADGGNHDR